MKALSCWAVLLLVVPVTAGELRWRLPERSAVLFDRDLRYPEERATGRLQGEGISLAPVLFASELDARGVGLRRPPESLELLVRDLGCSLERATHGGRYGLELEASPSYRAHRVRVLVRKVAADGSQRVEAEIVPSPRHDAAARRSMGAGKELTGRLELRRWFNPHSGRMLRFEAKLEGKLAEGSELRRIESLESWALREVWSADSAEFRKRVTQAIDEGAASLHEQLQNSLRENPRRRRPRRERPRRERPGERDPEMPEIGEVSSFRSGLLALMLVALQKSMREPRSRAIAAAREDVLAQKITQTYDLSCAILALEALYTPARERENLRSGVLAHPTQRKLSEDHMPHVEEWGRILMEATGGQARYDDRLSWGYVPGEGGGWDHSNTQFALLGLYAARLCGVDVPPAIFAAAARHYLYEQAEAEGAPVRLQIVRPQDLEDKERRQRSVSSLKCEPRGWGYRSGRRVATGRRGGALARLGPGPSGSMTAGAISSLAIARDVLERKRGGTSELRGEIAQAMDQGLAWLGENFSVRWNPGVLHTRSRHYYWLYSLARACELSGVAMLQGHDWYFEGATILLLERQDGAGWGRSTDDAFALLFLARAVLGPATQRSQR
jgi:hypothetical protein